MARVAFDPAQAPPGWDKDTMDAPDVVMLVKRDTGVDMSKGYEAAKEKIPLMRYDEARQHLLALPARGDRSPVRPLSGAAGARVSGIRACRRLTAVDGSTPGIVRDGVRV